MQDKRTSKVSGATAASRNQYAAQKSNIISGSSGATNAAAARTNANRSALASTNNSSGGNMEERKGSQHTSSMTGLRQNKIPKAKKL